MGEDTGISWTTHSWNPWHGCTKVSEGCDLCYMFAEKRRYGQDPEKVVRSKTKFNDPLKWADPAYVFTCSWSDFFHAVADPWRAEVWDIIKRTPHLTYQILTKRHGRIARNLPADWGEGYPNVWLGVSTETQHWADKRIPVLLDIPARVRWISAEPLLGPIDLTPYLSATEEGRGLDWVVVGGESGKGHRPMEVAWADEIARRCLDASVPLWTKQDSGPQPGQQGRLPEGLWSRKSFPVAV